MTTENQHKMYSEGWRQAMRDIANAKDTEAYIKGYTKGYKDAVDHFNGFNINLDELAYSLGLVQEYEGFYGQSRWIPNRP